MLHHVTRGGIMKTYKNISSLRKKINQTLLKYVDYTVVVVDGMYSAKFACFSELEKQAVIKEGFTL
jgi:hypothetical protein